MTGTFHEEFGRGVDGGAFAGDAHAGGRVHEASDRHGLDRIFLVSPDSSTERLETVARNARGFVYAAARMGVTG
ncbi:tryptophan synthase subunit alpha, partial [Bifidobacterium longum]|uniref:tryptophan synthase subunit alpha n=1 Tax=Bifidobacterium longum TaxID=216816 RepID=UPI003C6C6B24